MPMNDPLPQAASEPPIAHLGRRRISITLCAFVWLSLFASPAHAHGDFGPLVLGALAIAVIVALSAAFLAASMAPPGQKGAWAMITLAGMPLSLMLMLTVPLRVLEQFAATRSTSIAISLALWLLLWVWVYVHLFRARKRYHRTRAKSSAVAQRAAMPPAAALDTSSLPRQPLTMLQKIGFGSAVVAVIGTIGGYIALPHIQLRREIQAERNQAAKALADKKIEADKLAQVQQKFIAEANAPKRPPTGLPKFVPISVKEFAKDIDNFPASYGALSMKGCYATIADPANKNDDDALIILFRETQNGGVRAFARGAHSETELAKREGSDKNPTSFFGMIEGSLYGNLQFGDGEPRFPLLGELVVTSAGYKPAKYKITLAIDTPLKCDWMRPRCYGMSETNLPDLPKALITEHCADRSRMRFFPPFTYEK
jgi:hypothetical protein